MFTLAYGGELLSLIVPHEKVVIYLFQTSCLTISLCVSSFIYYSNE